MVSYGFQESKPTNRLPKVLSLQVGTANSPCDDAICKLLHVIGFIGYSNQCIPQTELNK